MQPGLRYKDSSSYGCHRDPDRFRLSDAAGEAKVLDLEINPEYRRVAEGCTLFFALGRLVE